MTVGELIKKLESVDRNKILVTQIIAKDGKAWNMLVDFIDIPNTSLVQIRVSHPNLKTLTDSDIEGNI